MLTVDAKVFYSEGALPVLSMFKKHIFYNAGILSGFLVLLSLAYWPAISMRYVYHDSLVFFLDTDVRFLPPGTIFSFITGRYLGAVFLAVIGRLVSQVSDLEILRFLSIVQLSVCGLLLTNFLRKNFLKPLESFFVVFILLTLPAFQITVCQGGMAFYPMSILMILLSFILAFDAPDKKSIWTYCSLPVLGSVFLMIVSLCIYQSGAMFFWALTAAVILFSQKETFLDLQNKIGRIFFVGLLSMAIYRLILELNKKLYLSYTSRQDYSPYLLTNQVLAKIKWFLTDPVVKVLNFWNIIPTKGYALCFVFFVAGGIFLALLHAKRKDILLEALKKGIIKALILSGLFFLTSLPNLLFPENISFYRCYMALSAFCVFLSFWVLLQYKNFFLSLGRVARAVILCLLVGFGLFQAYQTTWRFRAQPSAEELDFLQETLQSVNLNQFSRVYLIQPNQARLYTSDDEYGNLTTSFGNDIIGFFSCGIIGLMKNSYQIYHIDYDPVSGKTIYFFKRQGEDTPEYSYRVILSFGFEPKTQADFAEPTLIIDMNRVVDKIVKK